MRGEPNLIKVGQTIKPLKRRLQELNTGNPYRLQIVAAWRVTSGKLGEKAAHSYLDNDPTCERAKFNPTYGGGREWFIVNGGLSEVYKGIKTNLTDEDVFVKRVI